MKELAFFWVWGLVAIALIGAERWATQHDCGPSADLGTNGRPVWCRP